MEPGEPEFLPSDTDGAVALAEEERDTCPSCGFLKAWCRDRDNQFSFVVHEDQCHATYALTEHRDAVNAERNDAQRAAIQSVARFADGKEPDLMAGLDLGEHAPQGHDEADQDQQEH